MADKYFRLVCFVVNICPEPLRDFFIKLAKDDARTSYTDIDAYLSTRHGDVVKLEGKRKIRQDQYTLMYPGHGTADLKQWDVTLLITLITELFAGRLKRKPKEKAVINEILDIRNQVQHLPNTSSISDEDFDYCWGRLESATMTLAKELFNAAQEDEFRQKIYDTKTSHLPDLGDALRKWYEETIRQISDTIQGMKMKLDKVECNTRKTNSILRQVTVEHLGPSGEKSKRIKTADGILAQLQASFETTMKELPDSFCAPAEVTDIRTKLRDHHHVVVTGSYNSCYVGAALAAINGLGYNNKRCAEMHKSSDWRHIDLEDVDLVFCRNPFGNSSYDENKAKSMADIFNRMMHATKGQCDKTLDIVVVTDMKILMECKQYHDHVILEEVVKVFDDASEAHPSDLTLEEGSQNKNPDTNNLRVMSSNFLKRYSISSLQADDDFLKYARVKFKEKKAIVLTGPEKCGKTSVAVALTSSYHPSRCSLLAEPNDFKKIDLQNVCMVIIDEFAGKYSYEEKDVYKWYDMFDHIYDFVISGQMKVVVTCEQSKLDRCCNEISVHPLLEHRVCAPKRKTDIKQEVLHLNTENTLSVEDNCGRQIDTDTIMVTSEEGIPEVCNTPSRWENLPKTQGLPQPDRRLDPANTHGTAASGITASSNLPPPSRRNILPGQTLSTERGVVTDQLSSIHGHQRIQRVPNTQASISSVRSLIGSRVLSVKDMRQRNVRVNSDIYDCDIFGSCLLPSGEILLADENNNRLKKLDDRYQRIIVCDLPDSPWGVCYIGNYVAVVVLASNKLKLQFVDTRGDMTLTRSVNIDHLYTGLTYHDNQLYVTDTRSVYVYGTDGIKQRVLYTDQFYDPFFLQIAISDDGSLIYLTDIDRGLITLDSSGNHLYTFEDSELGGAGGVCVDGDGHVLVSSFYNNQILQISSDGKQKLGVIAKKADDIHRTRTLCFDKDKTTLVAAGVSNNIRVMKLQQ